ncbi:GGDEF domain-containing protein [Brevibacillus sp. NPDC058079]|uniref:GGDEF domain-containing protein n=1 Tax=Brevibacillus sp. NPDC058079 TaxID=3346330 RepID=UPI0036ECFBB6
MFVVGSVQWIEWMGYPLFIFIAYWVGLQYDKVRFFAEKDVLTNLYNRRFVLHSFNRISDLVKRNNKKYYILVIDCNDFKMINDTHGHEMGDEVLRQISLILSKRTRQSDIAARWGGDEFLLIGEYQGDIGLQILINRIKSKIHSLSSKLNIQISVSIGYSICPDDHNVLQELVSLADTKMYREKQINRREKLLNA